MAKLTKFQTTDLANTEKMILEVIEEKQENSITVERKENNHLHFLPQDKDLLPSNEKYDNHYEVTLWDNFQELSPVQQKALSLMISGKPKGEIAQELGVDRKTIYLWMQDDLFTECLKRWQKKLLIEVHEHQKEIYQKALRALDAMLENPISPELYLETVKFALTNLKP